jgi:glutamyl-Q tRNA(Asp) synthetase
VADAPYVGRFAPSPTGPLHFGSLVAATGSYLRARQAGGRWLLRIEDIDPPREVAGASDDILRTLERFGFEWDGEVVFQSTRLARYRDALAALAPDLYTCLCSRAEIAAAAQAAGLAPGRYPGTCRDRDRQGAGALRIRCDTLPAFDDALHGHVVPARGADDFVIWRRDDLPAYQWAVTVDDAWQGITEIVRGADLLATTPRQVFLLQRLGAVVPRFLHLPLVVTADGHKLSKQSGARALPERNMSTTLCAALAALGADVPAAARHEPLPQLWLWACRNWTPNRLKNIATIPFVAD